MMHFCVWAVTKTNDENELDKIMQPYHEFECTGVLDEYVNYVLAKDDEFESLPKYLAENPNKTVIDYLDELYFYDRFYYESDVVPSQEELKNNDVYKYAIVSDDERRIIKYYTLTNPNAKWDWWTIGGRWHNDNNCIKKTEFNIDDWFAEHENAPCCGLVDESGWYGGVCKNDEEWKAEFLELWNKIPNDSYIWNLDCHI